MTAAAMIFGMVPMAIGFGEGGAQAAPLGRAVIGGLIVVDVRDADHPAVDLRHSAAHGVRHFAIAESDGSRRADTMNAT